MESIHHLMKVVAGAPNIRPAWFFDTAQQGEGLNDIGTHLVDLVQWTLFPEQAIDYKADIQVLSAQRWPTTIPEADFSSVTGGQGFPASAAGEGQERRARVLLQHARVVHAARRPREAERDLGLGSAGGRGRSPLRRLSRQDGARSRSGRRKADGYKPELYVVPNPGADVVAVLAPSSGGSPSIATDLSGCRRRRSAANEIHIVIPDTFRVGHEAHFAQVTRNFLATCRIARSCRRGSGRTCWRSTT